MNGRGIIFSIRDDISSTLLNTETSTEGLYVEISEKRRSG